MSTSNLISRRLKPTTKVNSRSNSRSIGRSVHDALYNDFKVRHIKQEISSRNGGYPDRKKKLNKYLNSKDNVMENHKRKPSTKSRNIMDQIKIKRCQELFEKLDDDEDGYISAQKIDILQVSNQIIDIITPFLLEIESKALILNFEQFMEALTKFSKNLTLEEKNILFGPKKTLDYSHK